MTWTIPKTLPHDLSSIIILDVTDVLPVNPNGNWDTLSGNRKLERLTKVILHHDGMAKSKSTNLSDVQFMTNIANAHIKLTTNHKKGENFPYHIYVRSGKVYLTNPITFRTYGARSNNEDTVHICVAGNYAEFDVLTDADRKALQLAILIAKGTMTHYKELKGHDELVPTLCPGYSVKEIANQIIQLELEIAQLAQPETQAEIAYKIANQTLYYYNMFAHGKTSTGELANEGQRKWALQQVLMLEPEMRRLGMIK